MTRDVLTVTGLHKRYGTKTAVNNVTFSVRKGEIVGLLGPNGAGKTSIISMILSILQPDHGEISIGDISLATDRSRALSHTNFAATYSQLPGNLSVYQNLKIFGLLYGVTNLEQRIAESLKEFSLETLRGKKTGVLSSGEQARVGIAKAMMNRPELLLLDEPTASLDPITARDIRDQIRTFVNQSSVGVLWTSHNMHEVESVCDRILFLSAGSILLEGTPADLIAHHGTKDLETLFISVAGRETA